MKRGIKAGNLLDSHRGPVVGLVAVEPLNRESSKLVSASLDNTVRVWEPKDMTSIMVLDNDHPFEISALHFLNNANLLVSGHENGDVKVWNIELGSSLIMDQNTSLRHKNMVCCLASKVFRGNNNEINEFLFSGGYDGKVNVWEIFEKGLNICPQLKQSVQCNRNEEVDSIGNELLCMVFDSNTNCIVSAGNKGEIYFIEMFTFEKRIIFKGHKDSVNCLAMDAHILFSGSDDKTIRLWDTLSVQYLTFIEAHDSGVRSLLVLPSGQLVSCANGAVHVWDYPNKLLIKVLLSEIVIEILKTRNSQVHVLRLPRELALHRNRGEQHLQLPLDGHRYVDIPPLSHIDESTETRKVEGQQECVRSQ
jgi:WD40 repeat protein